MDRRLFLTGLLGFAGATAIGSMIKPESAAAAVINPGNGILDELDESGPEVTEVNHRRGHRRRGHRHHGRRRPGRRRRRAWRRVCGRVRIRGRLRRRCWDELVWI